MADLLCLLLTVITLANVIKPWSATATKPSKRPVATQPRSTPSVPVDAPQFARQPASVTTEPEIDLLTRSVARLLGVDEKVVPTITTSQMREAIHSDDIRLHNPSSGLILLIQADTAMQEARVGNQDKFWQSAVTRTEDLLIRSSGFAKADIFFFTSKPIEGNGPLEKPLAQTFVAHVNTQGQVPSLASVETAQFLEELRSRPPDIVANTHSFEKIVIEASNAIEGAIQKGDRAPVVVIIAKEPETDVEAAKHSLLALPDDALARLWRAPAIVQVLREPPPIPRKDAEPPASSNEALPTSAPAVEVTPPIEAPQKFQTGIHLTQWATAMAQRYGVTVISDDIP